MQILFLPSLAGLLSGMVLNREEQILQIRLGFQHRLLANSQSLPTGVPGPGKEH